MSWAELAKESLLWIVKLGIVGILIKLAMGHYSNVVKQRDKALDKNLDLRFDSIKQHIDHGLTGIKDKISSLEGKLKSLEKRVDHMSPSMDTSAQAIRGEVHRYETVINGLKAALRKSDQKFAANKEDILKMQATLSKMTEAIVSLNNKVAAGRVVKPIDANAVVDQVKKS